MNSFCEIHVTCTGCHILFGSCDSELGLPLHTIPMLLPWNPLASTFLLRIASHSERPRFDLSLSPNNTASSHLYSTRLPSTRSLQPPQFDHAQLEERSTQRHRPPLHRNVWRGSNDLQSLPGARHSPYHQNDSVGRVHASSANTDLMLGFDRFGSQTATSTASESVPLHTQPNLPTPPSSLPTCPPVGIRGHSAYNPFSHQHGMFPRSSSSLPPIPMFDNRRHQTQFLATINSSFPIDHPHQLPSHFPNNNSATSTYYPLIASSPHHPYAHHTPSSLISNTNYQQSNMLSYLDHAGVYGHYPPFSFEQYQSGSSGYTYYSNGFPVSVPSTAQNHPHPTPYQTQPYLSESNNHTIPNTFTLDNHHPTSQSHVGAVPCGHNQLSIAPPHRISSAPLIPCHSSDGISTDARNSSEKPDQSPITPLLPSPFADNTSSQNPGASKRWARFREKAESSFILPANDGESTPTPEVDETITTAGPSNKPFYYFIPPSRQHDPNPSEILTSQETLLSHYTGLSHGTCVIAPRNMPAFCKFKTTPFSSMSSEELQGWEKLVCFFLQQTEYVAPVKNNGPSMGGIMRSQFNAKDEASAFEEANKWIATHLEQLAPRAFKEYREALIDGQLPSMAHMEYPSPYTMFDFASFFTFTMYNFYNEPHKDTDVNNWTLVCWIPIFNPRNCLY
ncbi:Leucine-zipper-like transcriptional regulator 1 [Puccinia graminis f. sp. tritici]|uniref:Leucine-zipper-like transcriptional regulator 1 n=1 Tax=Puccinia graminis f. sp. tritici TaxID=56615 RepID=A0A5B0MCC8_PUCGR|nr:Leucine-zipper-like transcriptional regulator 1 [Puccinia graminis f. sp. tritici]